MPCHDEASSAHLPTRCSTTSIDFARRKSESAVEVGSPEFIAAAKQAEVISRLAFRWAQMQLQMALSVQGESSAISADVRLINVEPRPLDRVLAQWREAQLRSETANPGSPESEATVRDIERLREEYQAGHRSRVKDDGGEPAAQEPQGAPA